MASIEYQRMYKKKYPWRIKLSSIKSRCKSQNPWVSKGIKCLITADELKELWFRDKAYNMKCPSVDRIDNMGHYEYSNCRYIEHLENGSRPKVFSKWNSSWANVGKKGEDCYRAKLTNDNVIKIRELISCGVKIAEIAKKYNISYSAISQIKHNLTWKHI